MRAKLIRHYDRGRLHFITFCRYSGLCLGARSAGPRLFHGCRGWQTSCLELGSISGDMQNRCVASPTIRFYHDFDILIE